MELAFIAPSSALPHLLGIQSTPRKRKRVGGSYAPHRHKCYLLIVNFSLSCARSNTKKQCKQPRKGAASQATGMVTSLAPPPHPPQQSLQAANSWVFFEMQPESRADRFALLPLDRVICVGCVNTL